jgi:hypothetical protein
MKTLPDSSSGGAATSAQLFQFQIVIVCGIEFGHGLGLFFAYSTPIGG